MGPPASKRLLGFALAELLGVAEAEDVTAVVGAGEAVVVKVVVGAGEGEEVGVVMVMGVVVCCAATVRGDSHVARSTNPTAKTARTTIEYFSKARVRSVISPPSGSLIRENYSASARFSPQTPPVPDAAPDLKAAPLSSLEASPPPNLGEYATRRTKYWPPGRCVPPLRPHIVTPKY